MKITAAEINKLRKATGAGMMDCKNALVEAEGSFDKAIENLRKRGQKVAAKRADRDSSEGAVIAVTNEENTLGALVSLNCETDFVAMNDSFVALAKEFAGIALDSKAANLEEFLEEDFNGITIAEKLSEQTGVIGEKIEMKAYEKLNAPFVGSYIHFGNKIASLVGLSANVDGAATAAKEVAMQIAANNPLALDKAGISEEVINKELEIGRELAEKEGKPEAMLDKIAQGRLNKFFKEVTLNAQASFANDKQSVEAYVKSVAKDLAITEFKRFG